MTEKVFRRKQDYYNGKSTLSNPVVCIRPTQIGLNTAAANEFAKGRIRAVLISLKDIPAIGITFFNAKIKGSILIKKQRGYTALSEPKFFEKHLYISAIVRHLNIAHFYLHPLPEEMVPKDYEGSECYYASLTEENSLRNLKVKK
jgi:hypothetical protein